MRRLSMWRNYRAVPAGVLPRAWRNWVLDRGSLTKRLIKAAEGDFSVRIRSLAWAYPRRDELQTLDINSRDIALIREVDLLVKGQVWVTARSVIPYSTLRGEERQLQYLGQRPLGAFLFKSKGMKRKEIEIAAFELENKEQAYGRRSVFLLHNKPLLVCELFMPEVIQGNVLGAHA